MLACISTESFHNIAVGLSAIAIPALGVFGFNAWRRELRGKTRFDVARRTLSALYHVRDTVEAARNAAMSGIEWSDRKPDDNESPESTHILDQAYAYGKRILRVKSARDELLLMSLEVEALWKKNGRDKVDAFLKQVDKLATAQQIYFRNKINDPQADVDNSLKIIYDQAEPDEYMGELKRLLAECQAFFEPYVIG